jgi:phosphoglycolate phosphatase
MKEPKLIIFDCDGVLFDSHEANRAYFHHCVETAGYAIPEDLSDRIQYLSIIQLAALITENEEGQKLIVDTALKTPYLPYIKHLKPIFDFDTVLKPLREKKLLAVASNRGVSLVTLFHSFNLFNYFHFKVSVLDAKPKPHPEMLNKCLEYFSLNPEEALFIGDSHTDREASEKAAIPFTLFKENETEPLENILSPFI